MQKTRVPVTLKEFMPKKFLTITENSTCYHINEDDQKVMEEEMSLKDPLSTHAWKKFA